MRKSGTASARAHKSCNNVYVRNMQQCSMYVRMRQSGTACVHAHTSRNKHSNNKPRTRYNVT